MLLKRLLAPLTLLLFLVIACGGDDNDPTDPNDFDGEFSASFSGDISAALSGTATFASIQGTGFAISLVGQGSTGALSIVRDGVGRPGNGTLAVGDGDPEGEMFAVGNVGNATFFSASGTLTISASSSSVLRGSFSIQGTDGEGDAVTVTGTFEARCVAVVAGYCD